MDEEIRTCDCCGEEISEETGTWVDDRFLCENCVDTECVTCERCGEVIFTENSESDSNLCLCRSCYEEHYRYCECCNRLILNENTFWRNDLPYCERCFEEFEDEIEDYSYKPDPIFYGDGKLFLGVELEVDQGGKDDENALILKDIANIRNEHIYIKSDSSLEDGFEIVSHPMTLEYHQHEMDWESVLQEAVHLHYRSHQTNTCGLHVHVNRNAFGSNQAEQEAVIERILFFVEKHWNELFQFSRRSEYNMNRWSARYGYEKSGKEILKKAKSDYNRYVAVNLRNYETIEFRLFRGTLKYNTFLATLQMVKAICDAAIFMSEEEIDKLSWSEFVGNLSESELIQYLKERNLYVNSAVFTEEDL